MGIIYQKNYKTGVIYAYENKAFWDKEKKQSRAKRKLLGKVDPNSGEIVSTRSYKKKADATMNSTADDKLDEANAKAPCLTHYRRVFMVQPIFLIRLEKS